ncbi:MerR family transcriptional regulator [Paracoccus sanguinis]|uniref:Transcriptional regulator, MerR family n=1 Tax=Paracoccus sanguinis TaxID=1545044 RepID=A0A1H2WWY4_9RHOB|nr:MerR family transcriptional regulator [Paracoccus sanguinis]KGJ17416.1 MerR family transcriptional regulator [Paracoccus sanguinis]SDW85163.1 transcriptional regulator, MerR family [Paracoccus sanguinis]
MKIGELARQTGLSVDTLRFYERIGLIQRPARDGGGRRDYDPAVLDWIAFLARLTATGMRQADRVRYAALRRQGDTTLAARRAMIEAHRTAIAARVAELNAALALMDDKIETYRRMEAEHDRPTS